MDTKEQSEIYQLLQDRKEDITRAWLDALAKLTPVTLDTEQLFSRFERYVDRLIAILVSDPFTPNSAQEVGGALDLADVLQPKDIVRVQEVLFNALTEGASADQMAILQTRIVAVLAALQAGIFVGKAERAKRFDMESMSKMGHDLKTPINAITGFSRVILKGIDGPVTEFQHQDLTSIYDAGKKLLDMINDMFEVAKSDAGKTDIYGKSFDVADLLGDLMKTAQPILAKQKHTFQIKAMGDLGKMQANASETRWIVLSMLAQASRLAEECAISLVVTRERLSELDWLIFEVTEVLGDDAPSLDEVALKVLEEQVESDMAVSLITSLSFCKEIGGTLTTSVEDKIVKLIARLPARVTLSEK